MAHQVFLLPNCAPQQPNITTIAPSRLSRRFRKTTADLIAWQSEACVLPAFVALETFRRAGFKCRMVDCAAEAHFVLSEDDERPLPGRPYISIGVPGTDDMVHTVVVVLDGKTPVLVETSLSRLRHPDFPALTEMVVAPTHSFWADTINKPPTTEAGRFERCVEWFLRAPCGGIVMLKWIAFEGPSAWEPDSAVIRQNALTLMTAARISKITGLPGMVSFA